jgi:hypothetical protein
MFLQDTSLALIVIDPTRGRIALDEARDWNKRLEKHLGQRRAVKLLIGAKVDDDTKSGTIDRASIQALCAECNFAGFHETSALNGRGIDGFRTALAAAIDWDHLAKTSRPELFQTIRDEIDRMRESGQVVVTLVELESRIRGGLAPAVAAQREAQPAAKVALEPPSTITQRDDTSHDDPIPVKAVPEPRINFLSPEMIRPDGTVGRSPETEPENPGETAVPEPRNIGISSLNKPRVFVVETRATEPGDPGHLGFNTGSALIDYTNLGFKQVQKPVSTLYRGAGLQKPAPSSREKSGSAAAVRFSTAAFRAVTDQLAMQGVIVKTKLHAGDDAIVLQLPVIERYAASLIMAARGNPRGVPALDTDELGSPNIVLPGMKPEERLRRDEEKVVLEAVTELMIEHGLCFRHERLLVFPTLLMATESTKSDDLPSSVSLYYDFSGAIDNVYASLIAWLVIGQGFGRVRLWENRVEFGAEGPGGCGLRKVNRGRVFAHLDVYFYDGTPEQKRTEFTRFVHQHLADWGIDVVEHFELICPDCRWEFPRDVVQNRMARGESNLWCPICDAGVALSEGIRREQKRNDRADQKTFALMTRVREKVPKIVASVKQEAFSRSDEGYLTDRPIRILHLSDLHFTKETVPETKLQWLVDDIRKGSWVKGGQLDYVVISGDMTHQGSPAGFQKASAFVSLLVEQFGLSIERFIFVPGNHDLQERDEVYDWRLSVEECDRARAVKEGKLFGLPNDKYHQRFKEFSELFYHPLLQKPYPLEPSLQGVTYTFPETRLQFLTLNSCWEIDQFHRTRASIHPDALARLLAEADRQIHDSTRNTGLGPEDFLRIGVWHHPVADSVRGILNREFLENLQNHRVRVCLTGDVHEMRRDLIDYWHANRMHVLGSGSFGAKGPDLSEGSPRLYNLLEIDREFRSVRVHTRQQPKPNGVWKGWNEWPMPDGTEGGLPYFDIALRPGR